MKEYQKDSGRDRDPLQGRPDLEGLEEGKHVRLGKIRTCGGQVRTRKKQYRTVTTHK